ncbi:helix-turn-helix transcriptional regulator [Eubacteriales bacterium OttesenSCG-928-A19]|nr:helix-turn-helix transcriptional regulator [Eubacteriales bacterium OttesenSCG-928-A19]
MIMLTMGEKIKVMLGRRNMTVAQLAELTGQSRQNMSNKMSRDNFTENELRKIAEALDCTYHANFTMNDTGEVI